MKKIEHFGNVSTGQGAKPLPFSKAVRAGDFVYVSGQVAFDPQGVLVYGDIETQARVTLENVKNVLALAGCQLSDVVKANVWLDDVRDFWGFNKVYSEFFPTNPPARSCVQSALMIDGKVEVDVIAYKPQE